MKIKILAIFLLGLTIGCSTTKTSMIIGDSYDPQKNLTTLILIPYGNIDIPGQWTKNNYDETSKQHFFRDKDSTLIAVAKNPQEKYPFYSSGNTDQEFVKRFFEWEKDYYEKHGFEIREILLEGDFVVWTAKGETINNIFLYGTKDGIVYNFGVLSGDWTEERGIDFLKDLFRRN